MEPSDIAFESAVSHSLPFRCRSRYATSTNHNWLFRRKSRHKRTLHVSYARFRFGLASIFDASLQASLHEHVMSSFLLGQYSCDSSLSFHTIQGLKRLPSTRPISPPSLSKPSRRRPWAFPRSSFLDIHVRHRAQFASAKWRRARQVTIYAVMNTRVSRSDCTDTRNSV